MKAISLKQPWAGMIAQGEKTIETRKWRTFYRGDLLICSSQNMDKIKAIAYCEEPIYMLKGAGICVINLLECVPMEEMHEEGGCIAVYDKAWAWLFNNLRQIKPFLVKGQLSLFDIPDNLIEYS